MYYKLNESEYQRIQTVSNLTNTDYELNGSFIPVENLMSVIEDLVYELNNLEEKYKDLEEDLEENYKPIPVDLGISDRDFY